MQIITPKGLECDAIVPQCLDNQYTSDAVLKRMLDKGEGYDDPEIRGLRLEETHTEFIRSLLYSSTVVVNRAFLVNSEYLLNELLAKHTAIPKLIQQNAVIPYLQREKSLTEEAQYAQQAQGVERLRELESEGAFEEARCLRFSDDEKTNEGYVKNLNANFRRFAQDLKSVVDDDQSMTLAAQLSSGKTPGGDDGLPGVPADVLSEFEAGLKDISHYVFDKGVSLGRQDIYGRFFVEDGVAKPANVAKGLFGKQMERPAWRMLKKLIDLKYNANLPDLLGRYTLTPANMPGRSVLPFEVPPDGADTSDGLKKLVDFKGRIMDQRPATLPRLRKLNLHQVLEIRALEEWQKFRASQERLLTSPQEGMLRSFDQYQDELTHFQKRLGRWAVDHAPETMNKEHLCRTAMNLTIQVGLVTLFVALDHQGHLMGMNPLEHLGTGVAGLTAEVAWEMSKDKVSKLLERSMETPKSFAVKLLVGVSDVITNKVDKDHSYQLELIRSNARITRGELVDMIQEIQQASKISATSSTLLSEQSK